MGQCSERRNAGGKLAWHCGSVWKEETSWLELPEFKGEVNERDQKMARGQENVHSLSEQGASAGFAVLKKPSESHLFLFV